jgi:hypothetical protein
MSIELISAILDFSLIYEISDNTFLPYTTLTHKETNQAEMIGSMPLHAYEYLFMCESRLHRVMVIIINLWSHTFLIIIITTTTTTPMKTSVITIKEKGTI